MDWKIKLNSIFFCWEKILVEEYWLNHGAGTANATIQAASHAANFALHATNAGTVAIWAPIQFIEINLKLKNKLLHFITRLIIQQSFTRNCTESNACCRKTWNHQTCAS